MLHRTSAATVMAVGLLATGLALLPSAQAASYTFPSFNQIVDNSDADPGLDPEVMQLSGAPAAQVYNAYTVSVDWSEISGEPYSIEAYWAFADTNDINTANTFYADPGSSLNSASDGFARTLHWGGYLDTNYTGGIPLYMHMAQDYPGSAANWNNVSVTLLQSVRYTTAFSGETTSAAKWQRPSGKTSLSSIGTDVPYGAVPFYVDTTSTYLIDALFANADGVLLVYEDSFDPSNQLSKIINYVDDQYADTPELAVMDLIAGKQYYIVMTGYENLDFGPFSGTITSGDPTAPGQAFIGLVPEPASLLLVLASVGIFARRRVQR
jgi:hypothetical protein